MGDLKLNGATSGTITLTPTAVAGTNTITLPASTGTMALTASPTFSGTVTATTITSPSATALTLQYGGTTGATLDTSGNLQFNSGYGSVTTAYGCRAWINYNGTTATIRANGNISSVTKNSTGDYTLNFTSALPDASYSATLGGGSQIAASSRIYMENHDNVIRSTTQLRCYSLNGALLPTDSTIFCAAVFR